MWHSVRSSVRSLVQSRSAAYSEDYPGAEGEEEEEKEEDEEDEEEAVVVVVGEVLLQTARWDFQCARWQSGLQYHTAFTWYM